MSDASENPDFENKLAELEALVSKLEQGDLSLEDSLVAYESGVRLTRECQSMLDKAQLRIEMAAAASTDDQTP